MIQVEEFLTDDDISPSGVGSMPSTIRPLPGSRLPSIGLAKETLQSSQGGRTDQEEVIMPLTRSFRETVRARARRDVKFRQALLAEAMQALLDGNLDEGRAALRSCINATIGFEKLGLALGRSPKSLMRMFGPSGNPTAENLLAVIGVLQAKTGVRLQVRAVTDAG